MLEAVAAMFLHDNALNTLAFPSLGEIQSEVVGITADLLHGPDAAGFLTSGGTESILMAVKAARRSGAARRGITDPEIVLPISAHAAFHKAAHYFGLDRAKGARARRLACRRRRCGRPRQRRTPFSSWGRHRSTRRAWSTRSPSWPRWPCRSTPTSTPTRAWAVSCCPSWRCWASRFHHGTSASKVSRRSRPTSTSSATPPRALR